MKFSKLSQLFLVSTIGLLVATLLSACTLVTIDFVFVASSVGSGTGSAGQIETYSLDSSSGALRTGAPTVSSGGITPVAMVVTADYANLYVAHATDSASGSVVHFTISANGVLTLQQTIATSFTPVAMAVNPAGTYLYVTGGTTSSQLATYPLSSGTIGNLASQTSMVVGSDTVVPTAITVAIDNAEVYVTAYDKSAYNPGGSVTSTANPGWVFGFKASSTTLPTAIASSPWKAGVKPSAIATEPNNRFIYVTDYASNELIGYSIQSAGVLSYMVNGPFKTGNEPTAVVVDPRGLYIYVANVLDSSLSCYSIVQSSGTPSTISSSTGTTDTNPVAVAVDPAIGRYVYTVNALGNSVSGFRLNPDSGALSLTQATPYPTGYNPTALAIIPHGNHSVESVTP
jgi:6-phosphogluconolactonase (cycloisomerase 2 family)